MVKRKSYIRFQKEEEGDKVVRMEVFESDRKFLAGSGFFTCARDNLAVIVNNMRKGRKLNDVGQFFKQGVNTKSKSNK